MSTYNHLHLYLSVYQFLRIFSSEKIKKMSKIKEGFLFLFISKGNKGKSFVKHSHKSILWKTNKSSLEYSIFLEECEKNWINLKAKDERHHLPSPAIMKTKMYFPLS